jgi:hypothetical protein
VLAMTRVDAIVSVNGPVAVAPALSVTFNVKFAETSSVWCTGNTACAGVQAKTWRQCARRDGPDEWRGSAGDDWCLRIRGAEGTSRKG